MPKKKSTEQFIKEANKKHNNYYDYSETIYINSLTKINIKCPIHGKFEKSPKHHLRGQGCKECMKKYKQKNLHPNIDLLNSNDGIEKLNKLHDYNFDFTGTKYKNCRTKLLIKCKKHGIFYISYTQFKTKICCDKCISDKKLLYYIDKANIIHENKYNYSKVIYKNIMYKVTIICPIHGDYIQSLSKHIHAKHGCLKCSGHEKKTTSQFIEEANEKHNNLYDYSETTYINATTPVIIKCDIHGTYKQRPSSHLNGNGCKKCGTKRSTEHNTKNVNVFIDEAINKHGNKYNYSKVKETYVNGCSKVQIECEIHGFFEQTPNGHLKSNGCFLCYGSVKKTTDQFIEEANTKHNNKYDYSISEYISSNDYISIKCNLHGIFEMRAIDHLKGHGCKKCWYLRSSNIKRKKMSVFITQVNKIHDNKYDYSITEYISSHENVEIICPEHGIFYQSPHSHLKGHGCIKCANNQISKISMDWIYYLETTLPNIQHFYSENGEYIVKSTSYKADGYDKDTNTIYEFHGDFWHGNPKLYDPNEINRVTGKKYGQLFNKTLKKELIIKNLGYNYKCIWEHQWKAGINALKCIQKQYLKYNKLRNYN